MGQHRTYAVSGVVNHWVVILFCFGVGGLLCHPPKKNSHRRGSKVEFFCLRLPSYARKPSTNMTDTAAVEYEWLGARDAILRRPDTFLGRVAPRAVTRTVLLEDGTSTTVECELSPALEKMFDEIITNAIDHRVRDAAMTYIKVSIDDDGCIQVSNDGSTTIPTTDWPETSIPTPQVLFHELNAGSNLGTVNKHNVGGRNGVGATVTNIFSKRFNVEICNPDDKVEYKQAFSENASVVTTPIRKPYRCKKAITTVRFLPDYTRLGMTLPLSPGVRSILVGRAADASACTPATVHVNGSKLSIKTLRHYALAFGGELLGADATSTSLGFAGPQIELVATTAHAPSVHVCFVNGVRCQGTLYDAVLRALASSIAARHPQMLTRHINAMLAEHISFFISARINTPSFGSQSKDVLDTPVSQFGVAIPSCDAIAKRIEKLDSIREAIDARRTADDAKSVRKTLRDIGTRSSCTIAKYERATDLGKDCTLYVTEGDSAKAMVVAGFSIIGRRQNGVFPLRGKLLNTFGLKPADALKNTEIANLVCILGLAPPGSKVYDAASVKKLPYKRLMIMTDQDHDGSHIKGLLLAFFVHFYPSLLAAAPRFLGRFVTPVVKLRLANERAWRGFFSTSAVDQWKADVETATGTPPRIVEASYYKGLGTSTTQEAQAYFREFSKHTVDVALTDTSAEAVRRCFGKTAVEDRRDMLRHVDPHASVDYTQDRITVDDFCDHELVHFFAADNVRSIPSVVDGLKPSQRKVLYTVIKFSTSGGNKKHKVAQLSGEVAKETCYHHGEQSLAQVIVHMAQDFAGSNNVNLLQPLGQFGNRHGEKPAAPRYIFTSLSPIARLIFRSEDAAILTHLDDEGTRIEPAYFVPIVPLVLINGAEGIGTGFSTSVPAHSAIDVVRACLRLCQMDITMEDPSDEGEKDTSRPSTLTPWMRGFTGRVGLDTSTRTVCFHGSHHVEGACIRITELPPGTKTNDLRTLLASMDGVVDVVSMSTHSTVDLRIEFSSEDKIPKDVVKACKLTSKAHLNNMHLFNADGYIQRFETVDDILATFADLRIDAYARRLLVQVEALEEKRSILVAKHDFVRRIVSGDIDPVRTSRASLLSMLGERGPMLLQMSFHAATPDGVHELEKAIAALDSEMQRLRSTTPKEAWRNELEELEAGLLEEERAEAKKISDEAAESTATKTKATLSTAPRKKPKC